jgi:hypothetical protein
MPHRFRGFGLNYSPCLRAGFVRTVSYGENAELNLRADSSPPLPELENYMALGPASGPSSLNLSNSAHSSSADRTNRQTLRIII